MERKSALHTQLIDREMSWLEFNQRVLGEAVNPSNPLFEQMKFLSIAAANLDGFFMIRVGSLRERIKDEAHTDHAPDLQLHERMNAVSRRAHALTDQIYDVLQRSIYPRLLDGGIRIVSPDALAPCEKKQTQAYYEKHIAPMLTPLTVDEARPFPLIANLSLCLALLLKDRHGALSFAVVQIPAEVDRLIPIGSEKEYCFVLSEQLIRQHIDLLLCGRQTTACTAFRVTRNADLRMDGETDDDLPRTVERSLHRRSSGAAVRLELEKNVHPLLRSILTKAFSLQAEDVYECGGPIGLDFLSQRLYPLDGFESLRYPAHVPLRLAADTPNLFERIRRRDLLLHHPYDSFQPIIDFIRQAARDPQVIAVKQTLYRVSENSPIIASLIEAAQAGKQVTVLLELKARFDEKNNIGCGKQLEQAGVQVIYGMPHLKTHAKITLIVRKESDGIRRYVHLSTGNYNDVTALSYTDHSLFTCREDFGRDASAFFNMLSGHTEPPKLSVLCAAPENLRSTFLSLIERETSAARAGKPARITAKMNALIDPEIIAALYRASQAGVRIRLIVRGICCLRPGVIGLSENITVRSIVGRFLEHSRIYLFYHGGREDIYLSSADWMPRNLDRRIELLFPIADGDCRKQLKEVLRVQWADNARAHEMLPDGTYKPLSRQNGRHLSAQDELMKKDVPH